MRRDKLDKLFNDNGNWDLKKLLMMASKALEAPATTNDSEKQSNKSLSPSSIDLVICKIINEGLCYI